MTIFKDTGVAYLDSAENFEQICEDFSHSISIQFFLNRKVALCYMNNILTVLILVGMEATLDFFENS